MIRARTPVVTNSLGSDALAVLAALPAAVLATDVAECVVFANDLALSMLGLSREECIAQPVRKLVALPRPLREIVAGGMATVRCFDPGTTRHMDERPVTRVAVSRLRGTDGYACVLHADEHGAPLGGHDGLQHVERLIAMGQMVTGFAHEVRNPLAALKSLVENMAAEAAPDDPRSEDFARIDRIVRRMETLVRSSLQFGKPNTPLRQSHDAASFVGAALVLLSPRVHDTQRAALGVSIEPGLPPVFVDDDQLVQVLTVLLNNALDATNDAARVMVRVRRDQRPTASGEMATVVLIEVEDQGPGIPPEILGRIFDPFFTTKPRGTGLGLAIALRLVRENRGQVQVRSRPGEGTVFVIELPAYLP